jgi:hypothetical protein
MGLEGQQVGMWKEMAVSRFKVIFRRSPDDPARVRLNQVSQRKFQPNTNLDAVLEK